MTTDHQAHVRHLSTKTPCRLRRHRRSSAHRSGRRPDLAHTEIFGPIAAIQRFSQQDEAIARANDTEHGLAGYVFTENLDRAFNVADQLATGLVGINQGVPSNAAAPFGGAKQSGLGREGSSEGLEEYQERAWRSG
ncbi:aldehyde dehydrogenase family protein [Streptomyces sviceus]|uniref:aldehyde dehydrogenase family protein n=1 Tax=Streptomyces sviceus TaxID=285530 RepID=UPI0036E381E7